MPRRGLLTFRAPGTVLASFRSHPGLAYGRCSINSCRMNESRYVAKKQIFELTFLLDVLTSGLSSPQASVVTVVLTFASPEIDLTITKHW